MGHDDPTRRDLMKTLAAANVSEDAAPDVRLGGSEVDVEDSLLAQMLAALPELPCGLDENGQEGPIEIIGRLGEGGMGVVELAIQHPLGREVALKRLLRPPMDAREGYALLGEARVLGGLEHPNIVPVHAVGIDAELGPVVLLKRVQGVSWSEELEDDRDELPHDPRTLDKHLRILLQVCNAASFAHSRGIVHRDIKPANVMIGGYGEVYLLDWGLAFDMNGPPGAAMVAGTATFMSPEMVEGDPRHIDAKTDVYLLGATLHVILTGEPRHPGHNVLACMTRAALSRPAQYGPEVPTELAAICNAACARDKAARFPNVLELVQAVTGYIETRDAYALLDAARAALEAAAEEPEQAGRRLHEARFAAEQAKRTQPTLRDAARVHKRVLHATIRHELERDNLQGARDAIAELDAPLPAGLASLLEDKEDEAGAQAARVSLLERDVDPELSRVDRLRATLFGLGALVLYHAAVYVLLPPSRGPMSANELAVAGACLVVPLAFVLGWQVRELRASAVGRQFGYILVASLSAVVAARAAGALGGWSAPHVFTLELAMLSVIPLAVDVPLRGRTLMGTLGLGVTLLAASVPELARHLHAAATTAMLLGAVVDNAIPGADAPS